MEVRRGRVYGSIAQEMRLGELVTAFVEIAFELCSVQTLDIVIEKCPDRNYETEFPITNAFLRKRLISKGRVAANGG